MSKTQVGDLRHLDPQSRHWVDLCKLVVSSGLLKKGVDPVAGARGSVSVIDNTRPAQNRERQRPGPDLFFSSLLEFCKLAVGGSLQVLDSGAGPRPAVWEAYFKFRSRKSSMRAFIWVRGVPETSWVFRG